MDLNKDARYTFVISLDSTEQHGPFLPLGSDTYIHNEIVKKAEKSLPNVVFLPTIPISCAKEHKVFMGTVWVEEKTLYSILEDICIPSSVFMIESSLLVWYT